MCSSDLDIAAGLARVETLFEQQLSSDFPAVNDLCRHVERYRGKMLRPTLVIVTGLAFTRDGEALRPEHDIIAATVEMIHMATLVHDDLVDGARVRRGAPAAWSVFGAQAALGAGDYLFSCAFAELAATGDANAVATLAEASLALARGEAMQRLQVRQPDTTVDAYLERCALKTGKLFEAACLLGSGGNRDLGAYGDRRSTRLNSSH